MAMYRITIPGMKPVLVKASSKAQALDELATVESLSSDQKEDALVAGDKVFKKGDRVEPEPEVKTPEKVPEKAPE